MQIDASATPNGNLLQAYGPAGFKVNGESYASSILLTHTYVESVALQSVNDINAEVLAPLFALTPPIEFLIVGSGLKLLQINPALRQQLRTQGISVDVMDTGAACRTTAILLSEGRRVGAVLMLPNA